MVCTIAIYLASFLLVLLAAPPLMRHRTNLLVQGFVKGVYAAAIGAILAAAIRLGGRAFRAVGKQHLAIEGMAIPMLRKLGTGELAQIGVGESAAQLSVDT